MDRVHVVGTSGAGKTWLARELARRMNAPHVEIDELFWQPDWTETPRDVLRERLAAALAAPRWVVDGNYGSARDIVWARADTVLWLDYPLPIVMARVLRRTVRRLARREVLWAGNRESLRRTFSRDSILLWTLTTFARRRREFVDLARTERRLTVVRLRSPRAAARWLASAQPARASAATTEGDIASAQKP
jgi:adenylate kinase family enzyme